ncbi:sensor histidine kinase [Synoicihabitans lomoniglobus]|uniref:histidine kinase n=1 Tax=Synoicihabitans lomoniglobus TaxID=2909285 RepID=A0AAE9ZVF6_9BACT|nr:HAMP domain-containing histidine kinase [Opitutaceae bacterium LMO-M01]WED63809.1 HAMP domain-containing sensor histidine kinase [Opitutaceae bacterium LMO-M01]
MSEITTSPFASANQNWRSTFFAEPETRHAETFSREITWDNLNRGRIINRFTIVLSILLIAIPDLQLWRSGGWTHTPELIWWLWLHIALLCATITIEIVAHARRRAHPREVVPGDATCLQVCCLAIMALLVVSTLIQQKITGQVSSVLLGIGVYASCFYTRPRVSLGFIGGSAVILMTLLPFVQPAPAVLSNHIVIIGVFAMIFWLASRLIYSLRVRDFSHIRTIAEQAHSLEQANDELRQAHSLKSELVGIAVHDLRDPLNAISGLAQELEHELPPGSPARNLVGGIEQSARRISHLVENLLTEAERESRGLELDRQLTELNPIADDIVDDYSWLAGTKHLKLFNDIEGEQSVFAQVDPRKFRQLLENLVSNAVKYSSPGGVIRIVMSPLPPHGVHLEVHDSGAGLLPEDHDRIFGKFARLSASPTQGEGTTGLGLAIVKTIAEAHGGRVWAESPGRHQGSTFFVELP